jgi:hypothetical protein
MKSNPPARWFQLLLASILILTAFEAGHSQLPIASKATTEIGGRADIPGWETYTNARWSYSIGFPPGMEAREQSSNSWMAAYPTSASSQAPSNLVYVLVAPPNYPPERDLIGSFGPPQAGMLLNLAIGDGISINGQGEMADGLIFTRLPETTLAGFPAAAFENNQPWQYPQGTKEIRYLLKLNDVLYVVGGFINATGADQPGTISQSLFDQIISTFQLVP